MAELGSLKAPNQEQGGEERPWYLAYLGAHAKAGTAQLGLVDERRQVVIT
jgi:hypothetical protein